VSPLHLHQREDEYSCVLEGRMGAQLGDDVVYAEAGDLVFKPRNQWHTFWNAGNTPCRLLEIISPAGFEHFFNELGEQMAAAKAVSMAAVPDLAGLGARYGHYFQPESIARLCRQHGLVLPGVSPRVSAAQTQPFVWSARKAREERTYHTPACRRICARLAYK
jgi:Cupin domain